MILAAIARMKAWAAEHPEADTQGLDDEEWEALARAALGYRPVVRELSPAEMERAWRNPRGGYGVNPLRPNWPGASVEELRASAATCAEGCPCWRHKVLKHLEEAPDPEVCPSCGVLVGQEHGPHEEG